MRVIRICLLVILLIGGSVNVFATTLGGVSDPAVGSVASEGDDSSSDPVEVPEVVDDTMAGEDSESGLDGDPVSSEDSAAGDGSGSDSVPVDVVDVSELTLNAETVLMSAPAAEENVYPSGAPLVGGLYMEVSTSQLGDILIYVPTDYQYKSFTTNTNGNPVNVTASTITGYYYGDEDYYIRWSSFGQAQYRTVESSYGTSYQDLSITDVLNSNIVFIEGNDDLPVVPDSDMLQIIIVFLVGGCLLCLFMRRL